MRATAMHAMPDAAVSAMDAHVQPQLGQGSMTPLKVAVIVVGRDPNTVKGCGGCLVLHALVDQLRLLPNISVTPVPILVSWTTKRTHRFLRDAACNGSIVIYPETVVGSCRGALLHVRWVLAPMNTVASFSTARYWGADNNLLYNYNPIHHNGFEGSVPHTSILSVLDLPRAGDGLDVARLTERPELRRRGSVLFTIRKARLFHNMSMLAPLIARHIDLNHTEMHKNWTQARAISAMLEHEFFVSYDPYCFYDVMAAMLGAVSIVHPLMNVSKRRWVDTQLWGALGWTNKPGVAYADGFCWQADVDELANLSISSVEQQRAGCRRELRYARRTMGSTRAETFELKQRAQNITVPRLVRDMRRYIAGERVHFEGALRPREFLRDVGIKWVTA